jgi:hypothetical protein
MEDFPMETNPSYFLVQNQLKRMSIKTSFYQNGESFFFPYSRSDVDAGLPVARRQVLNGSGRGFKGFRIRTIRKKI